MTFLTCIHSLQAFYRGSLGVESWGFFQQMHEVGVSPGAKVAFPVLLPLYYAATATYSPAWGGAAVHSDAGTGWLTLPAATKALCQLFFSVTNLISVTFSDFSD